MEPPESIDDLVGSISDTLRARWPEGSDPSFASDPELLENLRIIEQVARAHDHISNSGDASALPFASWGHLQLLEPIGQGAYGEVFRAWDPNLNVEVALKLFHVDATSVSFLEREELMEEARTLARLKQENVVRVHGADIHRGRVGFWMEFILGEPLSEDLAHRGAKDADEVAVLGLKMTKALAAAHSSGVLHRDIKPSNVVREKGGHLYLMDFGAGTLLRDSGQVEAQRVGTPLYMAPEVLIHGQSSAQSDIYSLGVLLFHALTLRHPYEGNSIAELVAQHQQGRRQRLEELRPGLPKSLRNAIDRCLEPDPRNRYARATDLADDLTEVLVPVSRSRARFNRLNLFLGGVVALFLLMQAPWQRMGEMLAGGGDPGSVKSVAVLAFDTEGLVSEEATYLSHGLGSFLSDRLSDLEQVRVVPWVSSNRHRSGDIGPQEAAELLSVEGLVLGSLVVSGDAMSGSVSLVKGSTGEQLWSYAIEGDRDDILEIEREILEGLGRAISGDLSATDRQSLRKPAARSVAAYELYLQGAMAIQASTEAGDDLAYELFRRALEIDPLLAPALVGQGAVHLNRYFFAWRGGKANLDQAEELFRKALELDPEDTDAIQGLCHVLYERRRGTEGVDLALQHAVAHPRDSEALVGLAHTCALAGLTQTACSLLDSVLRRDPADVAASWVRVVALAFDEQFERAIAEGEAHFLKFGEHAEVHTWVGFSYLRLGQPTDALIHLRRATRMPDATTYAFRLAASAMRAAGDSSGAAQLCSEQLRRIESSLAAYPDNERLQMTAIDLNLILGNMGRLKSIDLPSTPQLEMYRRLYLEAEPCITIESMTIDDAVYSGLWLYLALTFDPTIAANEKIHECVEERRREFREFEAAYVRSHAADFAVLGVSPAS